MWETYYYEGQDVLSGIASVVVPVNDLSSHLESLDCPCDPTLNEGVLTHNSFDGREFAEEGYKVINLTIPK